MRAGYNVRINTFRRGTKMKTIRILAISVLVLMMGLPVGIAKADFTFGEPTNLGPTVNSTSMDGFPNISADGLSLYFTSNRPGGSGNWDLWVTTRATEEDNWGNPVNLGPTVNSSSQEAQPCISADGLTLYFGSNRAGGSGNWDLWATRWVTPRTMKDDWSNPVNLGSTVNSSSWEDGPCISSDGLELYFEQNSDVWLARRASLSDQWSSPVRLGSAVNGSSVDCAPSISADGLLMIFSSNRAGGHGRYDLWMTMRATITEPWGAAANLGPTVNSGFWEADSDISADGLTLYFCDHGGPLPSGVGGGDLWQVSINPVVDLNDDGIVDADDMCIVVNNWGTDNSLCDIGPMPWGDGIVDIQDLIVLAEHLFEEIPSVE